MENKKGLYMSINSSLKDVANAILISRRELGVNSIKYISQGQTETFACGSVGLSRKALRQI